MGVSAESGPAGLARADRARGGGFARLAARASEDPSAAEALTLAWAAHEPLERLRLAEAFALDARARGADPAPLLSLWVRLEGESEVRRSLKRLLGPAYRVFRREGPEGLTLCLARPAGKALAVLVIEARGAGRAVSATLRAGVRQGDLAAYDERDLAEESPEITRLLWRFLRAGGRLPPAARSFASAFDAQAAWLS